MEILSILDTPLKSYKEFSCNRPELDLFLKRFAKTNHQKGISKTFLLVENGAVAGFYTISMGLIEFGSLLPAHKIGLPKYPIPVARIGRLAVHKNFQRKGFGKLLLLNAMEKIVDASDIVAAYAVIVDAKDAEAKAFYQHFGFLTYEDKPLSLYLPLSTIRHLFR